MHRRTLLKSSLAVAAAVALPFARSSQAQTVTTHKVKIRGFRFAPKTLDVKAGDIIIFENRDGAPHTATANDRSWDTQVLDFGGTRKIVVTAGMEEKYFCAIHRQMKGSIKIIG